MASIVFVISVAIYHSAEKVHEHKEKKRSRKALEATQHGPGEELPPTENDTDAQANSGNSPFYEKDDLLPYAVAAQHTASHVMKDSKRCSGFHGFHS
jgi:hypothetical protein